MDILSSLERGERRKGHLLLIFCFSTVNPQTSSSIFISTVLSDDWQLNETHMKDGFSGQSWRKLVTGTLLGNKHVSPEFPEKAVWCIFLGFKLHLLWLLFLASSPCGTKWNFWEPEVWVLPSKGAQKWQGVDGWLSAFLLLFLLFSFADDRE